MSVTANRLPIITANRSHNNEYVEEEPRLTLSNKQTTLNVQIYHYNLMLVTIKLHIEIVVKIWIRTRQNNQNNHSQVKGVDADIEVIYLKSELEISVTWASAILASVLHNSVVMQCD